MRLKLLLIAFFVLIFGGNVTGQCISGQNTILTNDCSAVTSGWTFTNGTTTQNIQQTGYWLVEKTSDVITSPNYTVNGTVTVRFQTGTYGTVGAGPNTLIAEYNTGSSWISLGTTANPTSATYVGSALTISGTVTSSTFQIRFRNTSSTAPGVRLDNIYICETPAYTVIFNANGGTSTMSNQIATASTALTTNTFTRTGYTFAGWNTVVDGSGTAYSNGANYPFTANTTLYAQWTAVGSSTDEVNYANVQFPGTGTINVGGAFNVYAQTYEPGVTEVSGAGTGIVSWIGYNSSNADPSTASWTWVPATFNAQQVNNDEFVANIATGLPAGTYYYASRFQLNGGPYKYGGFSSGFWNGTTNVNGTLTVNPHLVDWANLQSPSTATITQGSTFTAYGQVYEPGVTNISASQGSGITVDFGLSPIGSNTNPNTWTNWTSTTAIYNNSCGTSTCSDLDINGIPDNDEYSATAGGTLTAGTYYYTFRYSLNGGPYMYGGYNAGGGGFWSGTDVSGTLVVTSPSICGNESFTNSTATATYANGSYTGDNGITWSYIESRNDAGYQITGAGIMLRQSSSNSKITSSNFAGGIGNFTCKLLKAFTGSGNRQVELFVNGVSYGTSIAWDNTITQTFTVNNINIGGNVIVEIRNIKSDQVIVDDISWTCYASCAPIVTSPTTASITATTATLGGNITSIGCSTVTTRGIEWSTTSGFTNGTGTQVATSGSFGTGVFNQAVTGLPSGTVIYYKAFATNTEGTGYSTQASFTTPITNDLCSAATILNVNDAAKATIMTGSTATTPFTEKDVWFSFTPSCSGTHNITVTSFSGDIDIELYSAACPVSTTYFDTSSGTTTTETITNSLTAGTTYYLRVLAYNTTAETTAFTARVTSVSTLTINNTGSPATGVIISGSSNVVLMGFTTTPNCATSYDVTAVTISKTGSSTISDISNLRIFYDANSNGIIDGGEASVSGAGITMSNSMAFTLIGQTSVATSRNYLLVADVSSGATGGNMFTGKITTSTNVTAVLTPSGTVTGTAPGNTQTITYAGSEINVTNNTPSSIPTGSAASTGYNTQFAATAIGSSTTAKTYRIYNLGSATLNVSSVNSTNAEFVVASSSPYAIAPGAYVTFTVIFSPSTSGTRTAIISIINNDSTTDGALTENPYTFNVKGDGTCAASTNTITPSLGPIGTEVTINSAANLTGATVTFNGISVTVNQISINQIKVVVPSGATSGNLVTTNASGCSATNPFTVIDNISNTCQGGTIASDLFISEVTDESFGSLTYLEIFNGTGAPINLASNNYRVKVYNNGSGSVSCDIPLTGTIANNSVFVLSIGGADSPEAGSIVPDQTADACFAINNNDNIRLFKGASQKDQFGYTTDIDITGVGKEGYTGRRKNTAAPIPSTTFIESDWDIIDAPDDAAFDSAVDYSNIGNYNFISGTPPTVTTPSYTANCKTAILTVSGTEGYNGTSPTDTQELSYQWLVSAPNAAGWTEITDNTNYSGTSNSTLTIANISGVINYQYYCQIRENSNTCYTASNAIKIIDPTITWNGTDWRDVNNTIATPSLSKLAVINADYNTTTNGDLNACSVIINDGQVLTVTTQKFATIQNDLTINSNGKLEVLDKGSLVMINDAGIVTNNGTTYIHRQTTPFEPNDYTYWSTPIALDPLPTDIETTFTTPQSFPADWHTENSYEFIPANYMDADNDGFDDNHDDWSFVTTMTPGKGYIIMVPYQPFPTPLYTQATVIFSGKVNNGIVQNNDIALTPDNIPAGVNDAVDDFNLIGNPYPSAISADAFINANISGTGSINRTIDGTLYFWTHKKDLSANNFGPDAFNYSQDDYAVYTLAGGVGTSGSLVGGVEQVSNKPSGYIASGQGFFVEAVTAGTVTFNNAMRAGLPATANSQFYKSQSGKSRIVSKDRIWLNLENSLGMFSQQLLGYFDNTTLGYDNGYDGLLSDGGNYVNFYSFIDKDTYKIQGRAAFDENDQVRLGYFTAVAGTFNINIDSKEGLFNNLSTPVYLEDKLLNVIYDLKQSPYTFNTLAGTFNDRFVLRYTNKNLATTDLETLENQVLVSNKNKQIKINSAVETIDKVMVYDLLGRQLFKKEKVNSNELSILNLVSSQQTLLVKVTLPNGKSVTKKIIY